jgi:hypothetical protein
MKQISAGSTIITIATLLALLQKQLNNSLSDEDIRNLNSLQ